MESVNSVVKERLWVKKIATAAVIKNIMDTWKKESREMPFDHGALVLLIHKITSNLYESSKQIKTYKDILCVR